jgi:glucosamine--fructose-6-phosphate aminotransferase (isomerizing)
MEEEVREQPSVLSRGADSYGKLLCDALAGKQFEMVLLVARGSSDNAALYARYLIETFLGIPVSLAAPSILTRYGRKIRYRNCLGIGISQSGAGPDVAEVLGALRDDGHFTLAITNTEDSLITKDAGATLLLGAGKENSVAATKTYTASLLALYETVRALGADLPHPGEFLPGDVWVESALKAAAGAQGAVLRSSPVFALARGFSYCSAHETALKLMECALISCKAFSSADFEHGPKALAGHGSCAISFDGAMAELAAQGCEIVQAPGLPERAEVSRGALAPIWQILFGQWLALSAARARGLNPDDPQHIQKVTQTR